MHNFCYLPIANTQHILSDQRTPTAGQYTSPAMQSVAVGTFKRGGVRGVGRNFSRGGGGGRFKC